jgi:hypothetical protein
MYVQLFLFSFLITITVLLILTLLNTQKMAMEEQYLTCTPRCEEGQTCVKNDGVLECQ